jgi:hypothetical protein
VILPVITSSWTKNPLEEWLFRRELSALGLGIHLKNVYSAGFYQLWDEEYTREWDSAGNYQLIDEESTEEGDSTVNYQLTMLIHIGKIKIRRKSSEW